MRWGILGAGQIAAVVASDLVAAGGTVLAVAARDRDRAAAFAARHGAARSYGAYRELLADPDVDVVYLATTHAQHHELALLALTAGKPVLVEKAFTLSAPQAREVLALARDRQLFAMEAMWMRFHPLIGQLQRLLAEQVIGEVVGVRAELARRFPFDAQHRLFNLAAGGGALLDLGVYPATLAWLVLGRPDTVQATGARSATGSDASAAVQWGYRDGRSAQLFVSAVCESPYAALVTGTEGWIRVETRIHRPTGLTVHTGGREELIAAPDVPGHGYGPQLAEVERCLHAGIIESPVVPWEQTIGILETIDTARAQLGVRYPGEED